MASEEGRTNRNALQIEKMFLDGRIMEIGTGGGLAVEDSIVWLDDLEKYDYVRVIECYVSRRKGLAKRHHLGIWTVGYSDLSSDAKWDRCGFMKKRVFFVQDHDRSEQPDGVYKTGCPSEAVDPRTVAAGVEGEITERAWGRPFSREAV